MTINEQFQFEPNHIPPDQLREHVEDEKLLASGELSTARQEVVRSRLELRQNYGVETFEDTRVCPVCSRGNRIRRRADNVCMACILKEFNKSQRLVIREPDSDGVDRF